MTYSPTLAIITALFEITIALWALLQKKGRATVIRTTSIILLFLAAYQILEVLICANTHHSIILSRIAFMTVTWLPPAGLLLISPISPQLKRWYVITISILALAVNLMILWDPDFVEQSACSVVFALFKTHKLKNLIFCGYYWLGLLSMIGFSYSGRKNNPSQHDAKLTLQIFIGTISFIVPSIVVSLSFPRLAGGLASILCHFAILLALFLMRLLFMEIKTKS